MLLSSLISINVTFVIVAPFSSPVHSANPLTCSTPTHHDYGIVAPYQEWENIDPVLLILQNCL